MSRTKEYLMTHFQECFSCRNLYEKGQMVPHTVMEDDMELFVFVCPECDGKCELQEVERDYPYWMEDR